MKANKGRGRPWTDEDLETLRFLYPTTPVAKIAVRLGRTTGATQRIAGKRGLRKNAGRQCEGATPKPLSEWKPTYSELCDKAAELHKQRVPLEIQSRHVNPKASDGEQEFAIFEIHPKDVERYWEECGDTEGLLNKGLEVEACN